MPPSCLEFLEATLVQFGGPGQRWTLHKPPKMIASYSHPTSETSPGSRPSRPCYLAAYCKPGMWTLVVSIYISWSRDEDPGCEYLHILIQGWGPWPVVSSYISWSRDEDPGCEYLHILIQGWGSWLWVSTYPEPGV